MASCTQTVSLVDFHYARGTIAREERTPPLFFKSAGNRIEHESRPLVMNAEKTSGEKIER